MGDASIRNRRRRGTGVERTNQRTDCVSSGRTQRKTSSKHQRLARTCQTGKVAAKRFLAGLMLVTASLALSAPAYAQVGDDFQRANGGLGADWTTNTIWGHALQIVNQQLRAPDDNYAESLYTAATLGGAQYSEIKYVSGLSSGVINLVVRARQYTLGGQGDSYIGQLNGFESRWKIIHVQNDAETVIAQGSAGGLTFSPNDVFRFEANGSALTLKRNGDPIGSTTHTDYTSGDAGVGLYNTSGLIVDEWRGGEITSSDTQPPTTPSGLSATAVSSTQINLVWSASSDNVGVTGYRIERCQGSSTCSNFSQLPATPSGTTYSDTSLSPSTIYRYQIRATDAAGLFSSYSQIATATTQPAGGVQVSDFFDDRGDGGLGANWTTNTIWGSALQLINHQLRVPDGNYAESLYTATALGGAQYSEVKYISGLSTGVINLVVRAKEYTLGGQGDGYIGQVNGFESKWKIIRVEDDDEEILAEGSTSGLTIASNHVFRFEANGSSLTLKRNGDTIGSTTHTEYTSGDAGVGLYNTSGLIVDEWRGGEITSSDTQPPTTPSGVSATAASSTQINLNWSASSDNVGVTGYRIERCQGSSTCSNFSQLPATPSGTTYSDTGLSPSTIYRYQIRATDAAGLFSSYSQIVTATTPASSDTQAPSTPTNLSATPASSTQINLSWSASTDNVAVTAYLLERCEGAGCTTWGSPTTVTPTSYSNGGLSPATTYRYRVRARDAANNQSGYSAIVTATTQSSSAATSVTYEHNAAGRLTRAVYSNGTIVEYEYDDNGNRSGATVTTP
jgi:YD repeat-containing protein